MFRLPPHAKNIDLASEDERRGEVEIERAVLPLLEMDNQIIAVTDISFLYIERSGDEYRYLSRSPLLFLLSDPVAGSARVVKSAVNALRSLGPRDRVAASLACMDDGLPGHLFGRGAGFRDALEFARAVSAYGYEIGAASPAPCKEKVSEDERMYIESMFRTVLRSMDFLGLEVSAGTTGSEPCLSVKGAGGYIINRGRLSFPVL